MKFPLCYFFDLVFSDVVAAAVAAALVDVMEQKGECLTLISWEKKKKVNL